MFTARKKTMQESAPDKVFLFFIYLLMILILLIILVPLLSTQIGRASCGERV